MTKQNTYLFNRNEALTEDGKTVNKAFRNLIENFITQLSCNPDQNLSTIEIEHICISELHCLMAEIRLLKALEFDRELTETIP